MTVTAPPPDRYGPQSFGHGTLHVQHARDAEWKPGFRGFFDYRDLGMVEKTAGKLRAHVHRPNGPCRGEGDLHYHQDRESVVSGKSVSVRVDLVGSRIFKKKT